MPSNLRQYLVPEGAPLPPNPVPSRFQGAGLARVARPAFRDVLKRYGAAKTFWEVAPRGIAPCFTGPTGTHKTTALAVLAEALHLRARLPVVWCNCAEVFEQLDRRAFTDETDETLAGLKRAPFVVLDDFAMIPAGRPREFFRAVVNARYDAELPTAYSANIVLTPQDQSPLVEVAGVNVARRIRETSEGFRVAVK